MYTAFASPTGKFIFKHDGAEVITRGGLIHSRFSTVDGKLFETFFSQLLVLEFLNSGSKSSVKALFEGETMK